MSEASFTASHRYRIAWFIDLQKNQLNAPSCHSLREDSGSSSGIRTSLLPVQFGYCYWCITSGMYYGTWISPKPHLPQSIVPTTVKYPEHLL